MRRLFNSSVRGVAAVVVVLALAGSAHAVTREGRGQVRERETSVVVKMIKKIVRALGDGLTVPLP